MPFVQTLMSRKSVREYYVAKATLYASTEEYVIIQSRVGPEANKVVVWLRKRSAGLNEPTSHDAVELTGGIANNFQF